MDKCPAMMTADKTEHGVDVADGDHDPDAGGSHSRS